MRAARLSLQQRANRTRAAVQRRLAEIPEDDGLIYFTRAGGRKPPLVMTPQQLHDYKAERMEGFDEADPETRRRVYYSLYGAWR